MLTEKKSKRREEWAERKADIEQNRVLAKSGCEKRAGVEKCSCRGKETKVLDERGADENEGRKRGGVVGVGMKIGKCTWNVGDVCREWLG